MQSVQLLAEARERVASGWCQHDDAVNDEGKAVEPWSPTAKRWSLLGSIVAACGPPDDREDARVLLTELAGALAALAEEIVDPSLSAWNDEGLRTQDDVVLVLDRAIGHLA